MPAADRLHGRILIVEDDEDIAELLAYTMRKEGFAAEVLLSGSDVPAVVRRDAPDLILLDLMLPGLDGRDIVRVLRADQQTAAVPIIMITARGDESDRVAGLDLGADDYIAKPFSANEVRARVRALLRRAGRTQAARGRVLRYGTLAIDLERHLVLVNDEEVRLTAKEFLLLQYFVEHQGRVLSRDRLLTDVWGYRYTGGTRTVDVHVRRLREKLPILADAIVTVKQFGYRLREADA
jgi:DNA-binding response OmpR family regulator